MTNEQKLRDALTALLHECKEAGFGSAKDYRWPKVIPAAEAALAATAAPARRTEQQIDDALKYGTENGYTNFNWPNPANAAAPAEPSADALDAARYRWLRNDCGDSSVGVYDRAYDNHHRTWLRGADLDAALPPIA